MIIDPFFSVVIPTYNRARTIEKAIRSVLAQSFTDFEIIVVDDGSSDNTSEIVNAIKNEKIKFYRRSNAERGASRNFGASMARGQFINFLDSDDLAYPNHLQEAYEFYIKNPEVKIFHLGYDVRNENGDLLLEASSINSINKKIVNGNFLSCNGVIVKRDVILKEKFNEDRELASLEDWELWIRMSSRFNFMNCNTITSSVIQHDQRSVMQSDVAGIENKIKKFIYYTTENKSNRECFGSSLKKAVASAYTYGALHLSIAKSNRNKAINYLLKGILVSPREIFKKRSLVIVRNIVSFTVKR